MAKYIKKKQFAVKKYIQEKKKKKNLAAEKYSYVWLFMNTVFNTMEKVVGTYSLGKKTSAISSLSRSHSRQAFLIQELAMMFGCRFDRLVVLFLICRYDLLIL